VNAGRYAVRCTQAQRAFFDEMRIAPDLREAVVGIDISAATAAA
jgi:hypothetical protein